MSDAARTGDDRSGRGGGYRWGVKDTIIAVLVVLLMVIGAAALRDAGVEGQAAAVVEAGGEPVTVFDLVLDREGRKHVDLFFDRAVGSGMAGDVLEQPPATFFPALPGAWKWRDTNTLRFEPSGGFPMASEYKLSLIPERLLGEGQVLVGDTEFTLVTDQFLVEQVEVFEEPSAEGGGVVTFRGSVSFNYPVEPSVLGPRVRIRDPLAGDVAVMLENSWRSKVINFRTAEVTKKPEERVLQLVIDGDVTPWQGSVSLGRDVLRDIPLGSSDLLTVRDVTAVPGPAASTIRIAFSATMDAGSAGKYVAVEGVGRLDVSADRNHLLLRGAMKPGQSYTLAVDAGLPAKDGAVLGEAWTSTVTFGDLEPSIAFRDQGLFLPAAGPGNVALETMNVDRFELTVDRVYRNNLFFFFQNNGQGYFQGWSNYRGGMRPAFGDRIVEEIRTIDGRRNQPATTTLSIGALTADKTPGLYRLFVSRPDNWRAEQRWLLVTGIGAVAKQGREDFLVWAVDNRTLAPLRGVRVTLLSHQNQVIGSGTTDRSGFWRLDPPVEFSEQRPWMVTVERKDDFTFLLLDQMGVDTAGLDTAGAAGPGDGYTAFLFGERDIYRPGETLHAAALVRDAGLRPAPSMPLLLKHIDPEGNELERRRLTVDDSGAAELAMDLPRYARTGHHSLELFAGETPVGRYQFQVEEFVPDRIKVAIEAQPPNGTGPLAGTVAAGYLFGPPAAGLAVETRVRLADATFTAPGYEGWSFRDEDRTFDDREIYFESSTLDGEGRCGFEAHLPPGLAVPSSLEARVTARVMEAGGRGVTALERVELHPWPRYVGLRRAVEGHASPGEETAIDFAAVLPDGTLAAGGPLQLSFYIDRWHTVLRRTPSGTYRYQSTRESELLEQREVIGERGEVRFTPSEYGRHRVVITDPATGASASLSFYASGWGYAPWALESPGRVELDLDREEYRAGQIATVQVRTPFPGKLLLTVEGDRVLDTVVRELEGNTASISLPVRAAYRPNVYVTATLVRPGGELEPGSAGRAFGAAPLYVDRNANRMDLTLDAPETVRSGSSLEVSLTAAPGATVTIAAVDEGILQLIAQPTPDPFGFFYRKLALGVLSFDSFAMMLPDVPAETASAGGGAAGDGLAQHVRTEGIQRVRPVTFWSGLLRADSSGVVRQTVPVPGFQGGLRLMAVAADGRRFGSAERMVRVRDPLVLTPTLPRSLSFGERLDVPVVLRNDTGSRGEFVVRLEAKGGVRVDGEARQRVAVDDGREHTVWFTVTTGSESGDARFTVRATGNGEEARAETGVPLRPDLPLVTLERAGAVASASTAIALDQGGGLRPGTVSRDLHVGALPLVQLSGKFASLLRYPYGCLEQVVSMGFPLVYLGDLARALEPDLLDPEKGRPDPEMLVRDAVRKAAMNQVPGGGFSLWSGGRRYDPWVSIYATHFLVEASMAGHPVDAGLLRRALDHLQRAVKGRGDGVPGAGELQRMAYGLYVLGRAGEPDAGSMNYLRERHAERLTAASRALLAAAFAATGSLDAAAELEGMIGEIDDAGRQSGKNLDSAVRNRALLLLALLDADPANRRIPELADRLARDARVQGWWTTQETSFALLALGRMTRQQAERPPWAGRVVQGRRTLARVSSDAPARITGIEGEGNLVLEIDEGFEPGAAFYSLLTRGIPTDTDFRAGFSGLEVERELLDRAGARLDPAGLTQGDLVVIRTRLRSVSGPLENVVLVNLLPSGLEVENPRLESTESLPWVTETGQVPDHLDLRDDRILLFTGLPANRWQTYHTLARAVSPGSFRLPPVHAEAMYDPALQATGERGRMETARQTSGAGPDR